MNEILLCIRKVSAMLRSTLVDSYKKISSAVTLFSPDIILLIFRASNAMLDPSVVMYIYYGVCHTMYDSDFMCDNLSEYPDNQDAVQRRATKFFTWCRFIVDLPVLGLTLFVGSWSDKIGRKLFMVLPCLGTILAVLLYLISTLYIKQGFFLTMVLCGAITHGLFGRSTILMMAVQSCVSDMTTDNNRTWRFGVLYAMNAFGNVLGYIILGIVLRVSSFAQVFTVVISLQALCILWVLLFVRETTIKTTEDIQESSAAGVVEKDKPTTVDKSLFRIQHIRDTWNVIVKKRENAGRLHLALLMVAVAVGMIVRVVKRDIVVLFLKRRPLSWSNSMYGYLGATDNMCKGLVSFVVPLLSFYRCKVPDMYLVMLGVGFNMIAMLLLGFSIHTWMVYMAFIAGSLTAVTMSAVRSLMSKIVSKHDTGKLFSIVSLVETLARILGSLMFTNLYATTVHIYPGLSFHVASLLCLILFVLMGFLTKDMLSRPSYGTLQEELDSPGDDTQPTEFKVTSLTINQSSERQQDDKLALTKDISCNGAVKSYHSIESEPRTQSDRQ